MAGSWLNGWAPGDLVTAAELKKGWGCFYDNTLSGATASVVVTLPTWGADVRFVLQLASNTGADSLQMRLNADAGANYYQEAWSASGAATTAGDAAGVTNILIGALPNAANYSFSGEILIPNYRAAVFYKHLRFSVFSETGAGASARASSSDGASWHNTAAITTVTFSPFQGGAAFVTGSRVRGYVSG